jgi:putative ABC transport system substrate-binding protein
MLGYPDFNEGRGMTASRLVLMITLTIGLLAAPLAAAAQPAPKVPRIGILSPFSLPDSAHWHQAFRHGLRDLGWVEGRNISIEYRFAEGKDDRLPEFASELVALKVELIVATTISAAQASKNATRTIPIVLTAAGDPVATGLVESLAKPGGNVTGLSQMSPEMAGKRLQLLKEIVPNVARVAVMWNPQTPTSVLAWKEIQLAARDLGVQLHSLEVRTPHEFDKAFEEARARTGAVAIMPSPLFVRNLRRIADLAAKSGLPAISHVTEFAESGGLVAYGPDRADLFRRAAGYVDRILKGAKPADLPVEQPTKFELVINLKTAKSLGLTIPPAVLARADEVLK